MSSCSHMLTYPDGKYETVYPFRAVWVLAAMTSATSTDMAVLRLLELVAVADDIADVQPPKLATPHTWAWDVLNMDGFVEHKKWFVDNRSTLHEGQKNETSGVKAFRKQQRQETNAGPQKVEDPLS